MDFGIPSNFVSIVASTTSQGLESTSGISGLLFGVLLTFLILEIIIGMLLVKGDFDE